MSAQANMAARYEREIPEGYEARIEGNKVIIKLKESEDERIRKAILGLTYIDGIEPIFTKCSITAGDIRTYLEKQKEQTENATKTLAKILKDSAEGFRRILKKKGIDYEVSDKFWENTAVVYSKEEDVKFHKWMDDLMEPTPIEETYGYKKGLEAGIKQKEQKPAEYIKRNSKEWNALLSEQYNKGFWKGKAEQKPAIIQWTGKNLKEVIDFTGKSPKSGEWFKSWDEFEEYIHSHDDILKLFCEDSSHYEVPVGAWIIKTPDGYNIPSRFKLIQKPVEKNLDEFVEFFTKRAKAYEINLPNRYYDIYAFCKDLYSFVPKQKPYPYGENETVDRLVSIAECLEMDGDCLFNGYTGTECGKFLRELAVKQIECKPTEWSEENRHAIETCEYAIKETFKDEQNPHRIGTLDWLKSLQRFNLQPKQEWSEEDEDYMKDLINYFGHNLPLEHTPHAVRDWLKSLPKRLVM